MKHRKNTQPCRSSRRQLNAEDVQHKLECSTSLNWEWPWKTSTCLSANNMLGRVGYCLTNRVYISTHFVMRYKTISAPMPLLLAWFLTTTMYNWPYLCRSVGTWNNTWLSTDHRTRRTWDTNTSPTSVHVPFLPSNSKSDEWLTSTENMIHKQTREQTAKEVSRARKQIQYL